MGERVDDDVRGYHDMREGLEEGTPRNCGKTGEMRVVTFPHRSSIQGSCSSYYASINDALMFQYLTVLVLTYLEHDCRQRFFCLRHSVVQRPPTRLGAFSTTWSFKTIFTYSCCAEEALDGSQDATRTEVIILYEFRHSNLGRLQDIKKFTQSNIPGGVLSSADLAMLGQYRWASPAQFASQDDCYLQDATPSLGSISSLETTYIASTTRTTRQEAHIRYDEISQRR
jgi:hypothetical protein